MLAAVLVLVMPLLMLFVVENSSKTGKEGSGLTAGL